MMVDSRTHCQIEYDPETRCIIQTWKGYAGSANFRDSLRKTIAFAKANPVRGIISDTRQQELVGMDDVAWLSKEGNPQLLAAGVQKLAFIAPASAFTMMGQNSYANRSKGQLEIRWFMNFDEAKAWAAEVEE